MDLPEEKRETLDDNQDIMAFFKKQHGEYANFLINWLEQSTYKEKVSHQLLGVMIILHKNHVKPLEMENFISPAKEILIDLNDYYKKHHLTQNIKKARERLKISSNEEKIVSNKNEI